MANYGERNKFLERADNSLYLFKLFDFAGYIDCIVIYNTFIQTDFSQALISLATYHNQLKK